jgi:hypothetical protein
MTIQTLGPGCPNCDKVEERVPIALSLASMPVIRSRIGTQKAPVYILLVVVMATVPGMIFGASC